MFELVAVITGSLLIVYSMWWIYFDRPEEHLLESVPTAIAWSYLHLPIFAAAAAVGAGLVVAIEESAGHYHLGWVAVGAAVAAPVLVYLLSLWALYVRVLRACSTGSSSRSCRLSSSPRSSPRHRCLSLACCLPEWWWSRSRIGSAMRFVPRSAHWACSPDGPHVNLGSEERT